MKEVVFFFSSSARVGSWVQPEIEAEIQGLIVLLVTLVPQLSRVRWAAQS